MSLIIAISGGSCSGKTTLAKLLQKRLGKQSLNDYQPGRLLSRHSREGER